MPKAPKGELTQRQLAAVEALLTTATFTAAAQQAGCTERALRNWRKDKRFIAAYRARRREVMEDTVARLQALSQSAYGALMRALKNGSIDHQLKAARMVLDYGLRGIQEWDLVERVEELERRAA